MNRTEKEQKILNDIIRMVDNKRYNLIFADTLVDWVLQDYKYDDRPTIISGLVKKGYLKRTKKGNAFIVTYTK